MKNHYVFVMEHELSGWHLTDTIWSNHHDAAECANQIWEDEQPFKIVIAYTVGTEFPVAYWTLTK